MLTELRSSPLSGIGPEVANSLSLRVNTEKQEPQAQTAAVTARTAQLPVSDLAVLDFRLHMVPAVQQRYSRLLEQSFRAESCARQLYVGSLPQMHDLFAEKGIRRKYSGAEAYAYLLKVACGLESRDVGEYHVLSQIKEKWKAFLQAMPARSPNMSKIMEWLFDDAAFIRTTYLNHLVLPGTAHSAKVLSGIRGGEKVLIVALEEGLALKVARELGKQSSSPVGEMTLAADTGESTFLHLVREKYARKIVSQLSRVRLENALENIQNWHHVFFCGSLSHPLAPAILTSWRECVSPKGFLLFMKAVAPGSSLSVKHPRVIQHQDIVMHCRTDHVEFAKALNLSDLACRNCARSREFGVRPVHERIHLRPEEYEGFLVEKVSRARLLRDSSKKR